MSQPDPRLNAYRADIADVALKGRVIADRYTDGAAARICLPVVPSRKVPDRARPRDTEYLFGEPVTVFDRGDGWAWVQSSRDRYVGYIEEAALVYGAPAPTHRVHAVRSHLYPAPELKRFALAALPFGAEVTVVDRSGKWAQIADGQWIYDAHLAPLSKLETDPVAVALRFLETPYLWGGRSSEGMDCSALIQFALTVCGIDCPRDTDMQEKALGKSVDPDSGLQKGDLVFWPGHVGIMVDPTRILHSNATDMATGIWDLGTLRDHIQTIENNPVRSVKRLKLAG